MDKLLFCNSNKFPDCEDLDVTTNPFVVEENGDTYNPPVIPTPPLTIKEPVEVELDSLPPLIITSEPTFKDCPIPTPPTTTSAPLVVFVDGVFAVNLTGC